MKNYKYIQLAMKDKNVTIQGLADAMDKSFNTTRNTLYGDNMTTKTLGQIAEALGCEIVLRDKETGKLYY